jgi:hypothetical protein
MGMIQCCANSEGSDIEPEKQILHRIHKKRDSSL